MADSSYQQMKQSLANGEAAQLYLFYGEEAYLREYYMSQIKKLLLPAGMEAFNLHEINGKDFTVERLEQDIDCLPMMSERTLIVVTDFDIFKANEEVRKRLEQLFESLPDYVCLLFHYDILEYKPDARMKLTAAFKKYGHIVPFVRQERSDLVAWIKRRFKVDGHEIDSKLAEYLIFLCGDLMHNLVSEIGKISSYAQGHAITRSDIDEVATPQIDAVVFTLTDAFSQRDFDKAFRTLTDLYHMQEAPIKLLAVIGRQLRQIYAARLCVDQTKGSRHLMELFGMRSSYPAEKLMGYGRRFSYAWCVEAVRKAAQTDLAMKSSGRDGEELLTEMLLELALTC
jgi:DNA polymerase III, delta subunit